MSKYLVDASRELGKFLRFVLKKKKSPSSQKVLKNML